MAVAKRHKLNPRELAQNILEHKPLSGIATSVSVAGPGFINIELDNSFLAETMTTEVLVEKSDDPKTIVVDYSSPNLAKELHVGHLRSTIIGDAMVRVLTLAGHKVVKQNHVGDWGTTFGKLIAHLDEIDAEDAQSRELSDLERLYVEANTRFDSDDDFAERARQTVVRLNQQDHETLQKWRKFIDVSLRHAQSIYDELGVLLTPEDVRGESSYNAELSGIVEELERKQLLVQSEGAKVVFLDGFAGKDGEPIPLIVQKSDGGYLYLTTDLAAARYRADVLKANRILYFTDARQQLHFEMLFALVREAGFVTGDIELEHHVFGSVLNKKGEPFRTREGDATPLAQLLQDGMAAAELVVEQKSPHLPEAERAQVAHSIGVGAIKYVDLSKNRINDYRFDVTQMLSFEGNTAPYLQYAHARIQSLFTRGNFEPSQFRDVQPEIEDPAEHQLAVRLLRFQETIEQVAVEAKPHYLCSYLYDLAGTFMRFYESCPVLSAETDRRHSRLSLCSRTADALTTGLGALGIDAPVRM